MKFRILSTILLFVAGSLAMLMSAVFISGIANSVPSEHSEILWAISMLTGVVLCCTYNIVTVVSGLRKSIVERYHNTDPQ